LRQLKTIAPADTADTIFCYIVKVISTCVLRTVSKILQLVVNERVKWQQMSLSWDTAAKQTHY